MATRVFLPGESLWTEEPGGPQSIGLKESDMTQQLSTAQHTVGHMGLTPGSKRSHGGGRDSPLLYSVPRTEEPSGL